MITDRYWVKAESERAKQMMDPVRRQKTYRRPELEAAQLEGSAESHSDTGRLTNCLTLETPSRAPVRAAIGRGVPSSLYRESASL